MLKPEDFPSYEQYEAARVSLGEICQSCRKGVVNFLDLPGHPALCPLCREIETESGPVSHDHHVRCPRCLQHWSPGKHGQIQVYAAGEHDVTCPFCLHRFSVQTHAIYHIASPALVSQRNAYA